MPPATMLGDYKITNEIVEYGMRGLGAEQIHMTSIYVED